LQNQIKPTEYLTYVNDSNYLQARKKAYCFEIVI